MPKLIRKSKNRVIPKPKKSRARIEEKVDDSILEVLNGYHLINAKVVISPLTSGIECPLWDRKTDNCESTKVKCFKCLQGEKIPGPRCKIRDLEYQDYLLTNSMIDGFHKEVIITNDDVII